MSDQDLRRNGTADRATNSTPGLMAPPPISLPKGGGAIQGMGEKFAANPVTGTGSVSVPIATSPGRAGFGPQLSLSYDSAAGNGPFGFGWALSIPAITRKTDKGLPQYGDGEESDVYVLSGAEDLVPVLGPDGRRFTDDIAAPGYTIHRYRPRIEGLFARIERWTNRTTGEIHWRSTTRDNVTTFYGRDNSSRIFDPADTVPDHPTRIFSWLGSESYDDKGNAMVYVYVAENQANVDRAQANERNRVRTANRYLKQIKYGNRVSRLIQPDLAQAEWLFEVIFDYDEGHYEELDLDPSRPEADQHRFVRASASPVRPWTVRPDPFSAHRSGFEVRTYRRCRRVLMFHCFPELGKEPCLVRSTQFEYADLDYSEPVTIDAELIHQGSTRIASFIHSVTQSGFVRDITNTVPDIKYVTYLKKSLPPLEFEYSKATIQDEIRELDADSLENLPLGLDGTMYQWVDLDGEGVSGILTEQAAAWFYKPNLGEGRFAPLRTVIAKPSLAALNSGRQQLLDLAGDGQLDVVALAGPTPGFYERTEDEDWEPFQTFRRLPNISWEEPNLRFVDLDGDGHADILISENDVFTWYPSLAEEGFGPGRQVRQPIDEERGARVVLADGTQSIYLADMCGDGLTDLVRIRNGEVCYWPNLGYGRFGAKVTMDDAPWFDNPDQFDQRRVRLADIDGSGTNDIIYLGRDGVSLYFNEAGNRWSEARHLRTFPPVNNVSSIMTADLLGNGTACLVWSSPLPGDMRRPLRFIDLMGGQKPHLLIKSVNNLGAQTHTQYVSSTKAYLADKRDGKPWITRLPFPVYVVERVDTYDHISGNHFTTRYAYHHGYFDGKEREFRGFGMVEQWDSEDTLREGTNLVAASRVPPVLTRTWFHTGIYLGRDHVSDFFAGVLDKDDEGEYYREPGSNDTQAKQRLVPDTVMPAGLTLEEEREASRALKGAMLRQEVYALDGTYRAGIPYTVAEQNFSIRRLQPRDTNRHAVFFTHPREAISYRYERNPADPRISHTLTLEVDAFGNVLKSLSISYGRRQSPLPDQQDRERQTTTLITYTESTFTNAIDGATQHDGHRAPLPAETRKYELTGFRPANNAACFSVDEWTRSEFALVASASDLPYAQTADKTSKQKRLIEDVRTLYRRDDLSALLPLGEVTQLALPGESYKLALTPDLLARAFRRAQPGQPDEDLLPVPVAALLEGKSGDEGGYIAIEGNWWIPGGRGFFDSGANATNPALTGAQELSTARQHFYLPRKVTDSFGHSTVVEYDAHDLLVAGTRDALANTVAAANDYRVLQPRVLTDPNGNRSAAAFDALGMVIATVVMGKEGETLGDLLEDIDADPPLSRLQAFIIDPQARASVLLGKATTRIVYDLERYQRTDQPPYAATLARETHFYDTRGGQTKIQISFSYSDGFGREIQKKVQAEEGNAPQRGALMPLSGGDIRLGDLLRNAQGTLLPPANTPRRWVGSGRTVFNNKGKPVRQYEPFFSGTHLYEAEGDMTDTGVSLVLFYDPVERVVATLHPNQTYDKVIFDAWQQATYDVNDTVVASGAQTGDPRTDPDIAGYVQEYFKTQPATWQTWQAQRIGYQLGSGELDAARKAAGHADTPTVVHLDALGRAFLTISHNRYQRNGTVAEERNATRVELDLEGNQRAVRDALARIVMRFDYDMLGNRIHQASMEAGQRWILSDVARKPIRGWDSHGSVRRMTYDELRRPTHLYVATNRTERLAERTVYGESLGDDGNHRTRVHQVFDGAGIVTSVKYDFKGNLLEGRRELLPNYKEAVDWLQEPAATDGHFASYTTYDALNRPLTATSPDGSVYRAYFNEANLLERVDVNLRGEAAATPFVTNIDYNVKAQRERIGYGNGALTTYTYDPVTFRLTHLKTTRPANPDATASQLFEDATVAQDLHYTYDPVGNLTRIENAALKTIFNDGQRVDPAGHYTYDALYRLVEADGREHSGQSTFDFTPRSGNHRDHPFAGLADNSHDLQALRNYRQHYQYDSVGNLEVLRHVANAGGWTRRYYYEEQSLIEGGKHSNRLTRTTAGDGVNDIEAYAYDLHGNISAMPHASEMVWTVTDQLQQVNLGGGGIAYYVYDSMGERVRKVLESGSGARLKERIYLGGFDIHREFSGTGGTVTLARESLHVMDDKKRIALVDTQTIANGQPVQRPASLQRYVLGNHIGSASVELAANGGLISYEEYQPYGATAFQAGRSAAEVGQKYYRYVGKERDEETGFAYHRARYYAPWLGRWTSCDPSGLSDGVNVYAYVNGNPVNNLDLTGNWKLSWKQVAIGAGVTLLVVGAVALTAGLAAGPIAATLATAGVSEATITGLGTAAVAVGTAYGAKGTADTVTELATGKNLETGAPLTDEEGSRRVGALPIQILATALGVRGLKGGGGGSAAPKPAPVRSFRLTTPEGVTFGSTPATAPATAPVVVSPGRAIGVSGVGAKYAPALMSMMSGGEGGGGSGDEPSGRPSEPTQSSEPSTPTTKPTAASTGSKSVIVKDSKWDYFFGRVTSSAHNEARSLQNVKDLETLGFKEAEGGQAKLLKLFEEGRTLPETSGYTSEYGVTVTRTVKVGDIGAIEVKYYYPGGDMSATPEISSIIPKIFTK